MKKALSRIVSLLLAVTIMVGGCVLPAEAKGVSLSKTTATLYVGGSVTLKVNGSKKKVTWSTSKKSVATVSSKGKVTAKKAGTATISAKVSGKTYKCKVTVKNPSLSKSSLSLEVGKSTTITLNGSKISAVKSSNTGIATVTKTGKITAKKVGTATITVTGTNKKKYTCKVTVIASSKSFDPAVFSGKSANYSLSDGELGLSIESDYIYVGRWVDGLSASAEDFFIDIEKGKSVYRATGHRNGSVYEFTFTSSNNTINMKVKRITDEYSLIPEKTYTFHFS